MPPCKQSKSDASKVRTLAQQLKSLSEDKLQAIFESVSSEGLVEHLSASLRYSEVSPPKLSPPSTPSPKKKKLTASSSMDTLVLRALASLSATDSPSTPSGRPVRSRTMTEKALQSSPSKKTSTITRVYPAVKEEPITPVKSVADGLPDLADSPLTVSDSDNDDLPVVPRIYKQSSAKSSSGIDSSFVDVEAACEDDDQPLEPPDNDLSDNLSDFVVPNDAPVQYVSSDDDAVDASNNDEDYIAANEDDIAVDNNEIATNAELELSVPLIDINVVDKNIDPSKEVAEDAVMQPHIQEDFMRSTYRHLPYLPRQLKVQPFGYDKMNSNGKLRYACIGVVAEHMSIQNWNSLSHALLFICHGFYVHLPRMNPADLNAVPVGGDQKYGQHHVELFEYHQESLCQFAVLCQVMNLVDGIRGSVSSNGVAFITRGEGKTPRYNNDGGYATPRAKTLTTASPIKKKTSMFTEVDAPVFVSSNMTEQYKSLVEFDQRVPVYDGRGETGRPFRFQPADFDALPSWRSYKKNDAELPEGAVVMVGFSINWYEAGRHKYLSFNILFVIVLHDPTYVLSLSGPSASTSGRSSSGKGLVDSKSSKGKGKARA